MGGVIDLRIITPDGLFHEGAASSVMVKTVDGWLGLLPGRAPVCALQKKTTRTFARLVSGKRSAAPRMLMVGRCHAAPPVKKTMRQIQLIRPPGQRSAAQAIQIVQSLGQRKAAQAIKTVQPLGRRKAAQAAKPARRCRRFAAPHSAAAFC